jgi:phosphoglycolate phosphatase-like HAD superfamily hydrolase
VHRLFRREIGADEEWRFRTRLIERLRFLLPVKDDRLQIPGAAAVLESLRREGFHLAFATGAYRCSALHKLAHANINSFGIPLSSCDKEPDRRRILTDAIRRSGGRQRHTQVVYVGDGPWDRLAARDLGIPFVAVGPGGKADIADYSDLRLATSCIIDAALRGSVGAT